MRHRTSVGVLLLAVVALGAAGGASAGRDRHSTTRPVAVAPLADAYVTADRPRENFGASTRLVVRRSVSVAYLRFGVAVPDGSIVSRATLQLWPATGQSGRVAVHRVADAAWGERTITYANAPRIGSRVATRSVQGGVPGRPISIDVTSLAKPNGIVSLAIRGVSRSGVGLRSREAQVGPPRLVVETSPAGGAADDVVAAPCGSASSPGKVEHVIWIWMENKPFDAVIGSPDAPFANGLAGRCGLATNYHAVAHPSLPNYIAATSGSTHGISDDDPPSAHPLDAPSIFGQVKAAGNTWRTYAESAPGPCSLESSGLYAVKHDPSPYYTTIRSDCTAWNVPMGTTSGGSFLDDLAGDTLPTFSFVVPNLCSDTHDCPVSTGDAWLAAWFPKILSSRAYSAGRTVVFVTWDEDDGGPTNHVPMIVVSRSTPAGARSDASFDHYSLLKTTEQLLGITTYLGHAGDAGTAGMSQPFRLGGAA